MLSKAARSFTTAICRRSFASMAVVRGVPGSYFDSICMEKPSEAINVERAKEQHAAYIDILKGLVTEVVEIPPDEGFPDCVFIEDTAVVIQSTALITNPGAPSRQGEVEAVKKKFLDMNFDVKTVDASATIDGGDVLHAGGHLFVGVGSRTNTAGMAALQATFPDIPVVGVPLIPGSSLHLKSAVSWAGGSVFPVENSKAGRNIFSVIQKHIPSAECFEVDEPGAALSLLVGGKLLYPSAYRNSSLKYIERFSSMAVPVNLSEFHKADGGMTCLSIIIEEGA